MPDDPKITAILPCFNHARFLKERVESVLKQTRPVDQIIFLDDASTDRSTDLAKKLLKGFPGKLSFYANRYNSGSPFAQWNKGVELAEHELIWIAETDDSCDPRLIEALYSSVASRSVVLGYAQSKYIDEKGKEIGTALSYTDRLWPNAFRHSFSMQGTQFNWNYMVGLNAIPNASAVLFRKDAYLSAGGANEAMRFCGDWDVWIRMCSRGRVEFISDELNYFRCHRSTSRAAGYTPKAAAEYFACRLSACVEEKAKGSSSLSAFDMIKGLLNASQQWHWNQAIRSLSLSALPEARRRYQELGRFPTLNKCAWLILAGLCLFQSSKGRLYSLPRRLARPPKKLGLF